MNDSGLERRRQRQLEALAEVIDVMDRLRSPGGCPWDAEQTHATLAPYAIEEAHEVAEAAEVGDRAALREELGDLLLQVVFHARLAQEDPEPFDLADIADGLAAKLRRRHPHVFGDATVADADAVNRQWDEIKAAERSEKASANPAAGDQRSQDPFASIPGELPALMRAQKVLRRATRAGIAIGPQFPEDPADQAQAEIGADLLAVLARAEAQGVDAEAALRSQVRAIVAAASSE